MVGEKEVVLRDQGMSMGLRGQVAGAAVYWDG